VLDTAYPPGSHAPWLCASAQPRRRDSATIDWESSHRPMIEQAPHKTPVASESRRPIVVLLVDDQPFVGAAVGQLLATERDIELHCCHHAVDAIAMANQIVPTMVLQDLVMPNIDGLTLVRLFA